MKDQEKWMEYSVKLTGAISEIFKEDSDYHIDLSELGEENNATEFLHALMNVVPTRFLNKITGDEKNMLEANHVANHLVFQYSEKVDE